MSQAETFISKFQVKDKEVYVKIDWMPNENDLFEIQLCDENCFWSGRFSHTFAQEFQVKYENPKEYNNDVKMCLIGEDRSYQFDFGPMCGDAADSAKFSWIKRHEGVSKRIGSVPLHRDDKGNKSIFIDHLIDENRELKSKLAELANKTNTMKNDLTQCNHDMERFIDLKTSMDTSLYGKFLQLLNSKKRRIEHLDEQLKEVSKTKEQSAADLD